METYQIRTPSGNIIEKQLSKDEVEFWISLGMYLTHGFHAITSIYAAEAAQDDDEDDVIVVEDNNGEASIN